MLLLVLVTTNILTLVEQIFSFFGVPWSELYFQTIIMKHIHLKRHQGQFICVYK